MEVYTLPSQQIPFNRKNKEWRKKHLDWADSRSFFNYSPVRKSVLHKKINYDLLNGKLHIQDVVSLINPEDIQGSFIPEKIQHYPIINSKLQLLLGEEAKRIFDYRVVVTNPNSISQIENNKKEALFQSVQQLISNTSQSEDDFKSELNKLNDYYNYEWQDFREVRANNTLKHYSAEYNFQLLFNQGFIDALAVGEEIYQCDIVGGEPVIERLNPKNVHIFKSGHSNKIEDADIIVIEDYWSPAKIIDVYGQELSDKDIKYLENITGNNTESNTDSMDNIDDRFGFINMQSDVFEENDIEGLFEEENENSLLPYDLNGNIKVLRVYWKSRRKIKKVKSYDLNTGEEVYNFYDEDYIINKDLGEEETIFYINQAWEGTKIGKEIYVRMRPRVVQYNRLSNPSRCHFGIVGTIYNINDDKPFSLVDMMKQYNYTYDVIHDRLNRLIARNWGNMVKLDLAKKPKGWDIDKWLYYAKTMGLVFEDSFNEGNVGTATGKLAGALNNNSNGIIPAADGNTIQQYINLLEFIKLEMAEVTGITKQREGQISNRETVGGVERATLQSSHITEWLYLRHDDTKKRAMECFLETAKVAFKGRSKKFQYILSDASVKIMEIDGDEFAESDYGLVGESNQATQELAQKMETLAQAALQNQSLSFSTLLKIYSTTSLAEKMRAVENDEQKIQERNAQAQQEQLQQKQAEIEQKAQLEQAKLQQEDTLNMRDNETKLMIANLQAASKNYEEEPEYSEENKKDLQEKIRQFDEKIKLDREKFEFEKNKSKEELAIKRQQVKKKNTNN